MDPDQLASSDLDLQCIDFGTMPIRLKTVGS